SAINSAAICFLLEPPAETDSNAAAERNAAALGRLARTTAAVVRRRHAVARTAEGKARERVRREVNEDRQGSVNTDPVPVRRTGPFDHAAHRAIGAEGRLPGLELVVLVLGTDADMRPQTHVLAEMKQTSELHAAAGRVTVALGRRRVEPVVL